MSARHYCGLFGVHDDKDAVTKTFYGLRALQHRGQEGAGIASTDGGEIKLHTGQGLVTDVFRDVKHLEDLTAPRAIGHVRYGTTGGSLDLCNVQPMVANLRGSPIALAHNGDLTNKRPLREMLERNGALFQSTMDSETILHLLAAAPGHGLDEWLLATLPQLEGAYSLLLLTPDRMIAVRDPRGFRPLALGRLGSTVVFASESCAFDVIGATFERELEPGEIVTVDANGIRSHRYSDSSTRRVSQCIFEQIYFARPDSTLFGENVHRVRVRLGRRLAQEHPVDADIVSAVPDSGNSASQGYSEESGIPVDRAYIKNYYVGRTFITPDPEQRKLEVALKLNVVRDVVKDKRVVVVDDSVIRGTTSLSRVATLRAAGAREVHLRISCPPTRYPCFYGINFPTREELIANQKSVDEIAAYLGVDSLGYLSEDGLSACVKDDRDRYCMACFDGNYPCATPAEIEERGTMDLPFA